MFIIVLSEFGIMCNQDHIFISCLCQQYFIERIFVLYLRLIQVFQFPDVLVLDRQVQQAVLIAPKNHPDTISPDNEPLILPNATTFLYGLMPEEFLKRRTTQITYKTADTHEMLKLTENGYGIALVPSGIISPESRCRVLDYPANISYSIYAAIQKQRTAGTMLEQVFHAVTELSAD